jgi:hypothetical protein
MPATHGFDGSDTITSNVSSDSWSALRASSTVTRTLGRDSTESLTCVK